jgi:Pyruvate/2-oxoacid:ferredoxin oxidoreductase delta subunit
MRIINCKKIVIFCLTTTTEIVNENLCKWQLSNYDYCKVGVTAKIHIIAYHVLYTKRK